jgi:hypothetical protein
LSLIGVIAIATVFGPWNRDNIESATAHDVRFVLNSCELGEQRIEKVVHSHVSSRSFTGDHLDAYAIKISHIELAELSPNIDPARSRWYRGDQLPAVVGDAVDFVEAWRHELPWFPSERELRSSEFYVYPWSIDYHGVQPAAAELIFIRPSDRMIFYFGAKS